jgi:hypothetical protein
MKRESFGPSSVILATANNYDTKDVVVSDIGVVKDENGKKIVKTGTIVGGIGSSVMTDQYKHVARHGSAALETKLDGSDNDLLFVAKTTNATTIAYVDPAAANTALAVAVSSYAVTVTLGTDAGGAIISTANDVKAAVNAHAGASAVIEARNIASDSGEGIVAAMPATTLSAPSGVTNPEEVLFNDVDVSDGPRHGAMLYMGSVEVNRLPIAPTAAQKSALPRISFMDYSNRAPV